MDGQPIYDDVSEGDALLPHQQRRAKRLRPAVGAAVACVAAFGAVAVVTKSRPTALRSVDGAKTPTIVISLLDDQGYADVPPELRNTPEGHLMAQASARPGTSREHSSNPRPEAEDGAQPPANREHHHDRVLGHTFGRAAWRDREPDLPIPQRADRHRIVIANPLVQHETQTRGRGDMLLRQPHGTDDDDIGVAQFGQFLGLVTGIEIHHLITIRLLSLDQSAQTRIGRNEVKNTLGHGLLD